MKLTFVNPRNELQPYIESFWVFESPNGFPATDSSVVAPNGWPSSGRPTSVDPSQQKLSPRVFAPPGAHKAKIEAARAG